MTYSHVVSPDEALRDIQGYAAAGQIHYTRHARERMAERNVAAADVQHCLRQASRCTEADGGKWKVNGRDLDGDALDVIVALEGGVIVVTLF